MTVQYKSEWMEGVSSEDAMIESLHEQSLSKHPCVAASGRMLKEIMPGAMRVLKAEDARGSNDDLIATAAADAVVSLMMSYARSLARSDETLTVLVAMKMQMRMAAGFKHCLTEVTKQARAKAGAQP
jgi:hypothetical protein